MSRIGGVTFAVAAAVLFGLTVALQHLAAGRVQRRAVLDPRLLTRLATDRAWLLGGACDVAAALMQASASRLVPVTVVQPILVLGLPVAVVLRDAFAGRWPRWRDITGCLVTACSVVVFIGAAQPYGAAVVPTGRGLTLIGAGLAGITVLALASRHSRSPALPAALAGGVALGLTGVLLRAVVGGWHASPEPRWYLAAALLAVAGVLGLLTTQSAFQYGALPGPLAALTLVEPAVATVVAAAVLGEHLRLDGARLPLVAIALLSGAVAVIGLARGR